MKLVKEYINEKFVKDSDPIHDLGIGIKRFVEKWVSECTGTYHMGGKLIINSDYTINVDGNFCMQHYKYEKLPEYIQFNLVTGFFMFNYNDYLTSLQGFPIKVLSNFGINDCPNLTSLKYAPEYVGGKFSCDNCSLTSLEYAAKYVGNGFACYGNPVKFTEKDVRAVSNVVNGRIYV